MTMALADDIKRILQDSLMLGDEVQDMDGDSRLLGAVPELDSVVTHHWNAPRLRPGPGRRPVGLGLHRQLIGQSNPPGRLFVEKGMSLCHSRLTALQNNDKADNRHNG